MFAVTGAFGYTGRHIAERLLESGATVLNLTGRPWLPDPFHGRFGSRFITKRACFHDERATRSLLEGVKTLFNTTWIRFPSGGHTFERTVEDSARLFHAARAAGVSRVVHVSVSNPSEQSPLPYFAGKARVERHLRESGLSFAIVRPTLLFGPGSEEALLINNIAWFLRSFPIFGLPGDGSYLVQPVSMNDLVSICIDSAHRAGNVTIDAAGPEKTSFRNLVKLVRDAVGSRAVLAGMPRAIVAAACGIVSPFLHDTVLTRDEIDGLASGLLVSTDPPTGYDRFEHWLSGVSSSIGTRYISDRVLHMDGRLPPPKLEKARA